MGQDPSPNDRRLPRPDHHRSRSSRSSTSSLTVSGNTASTIQTHQSKPRRRGASIDVNTWLAKVKEEGPLEAPKDTLHRHRIREEKPRPTRQPRFPASPLSPTRQESDPRPAAYDPDFLLHYNRRAPLSDQSYSSLSTSTTASSTDTIPGDWRTVLFPRRKIPRIQEQQFDEDEELEAENSSTGNSSMSLRLSALTLTRSVPHSIPLRRTVSQLPEAGSDYEPTNPESETTLFGIEGRENHIWTNIKQAVIGPLLADRPAIYTPSAIQKTMVEDEMDELELLRNVGGRVEVRVQAQHDVATEVQSLVEQVEETVIDNDVTPKASRINQRALSEPASPIATKADPVQEGLPGFEGLTRVPPPGRYDTRILPTHMVPESPDPLGSWSNESFVDAGKVVQVKRGDAKRYTGNWRR